MFTDTNSLVKAGADFIFSQSQSINNLNNSYFNRDKHTGNDKHHGARNNSGSQHQKTFLSNEGHGRRSCCCLFPCLLLPRHNLFVLLAEQPSCLVSLLSPRTAGAAYLTSSVCLYSDVRLHQGISPADGLLERRGSAWTALSGAFTNATLRHSRYLSPNE